MTILFIVLLVVLAFCLLDADDRRRARPHGSGYIPSPTAAERRRKRINNWATFAAFFAALCVWALWMQGSL